MKTKQPHTGNKKNIAEPKHEELKTDPPLSEKDEIKQAEVRTNKAAKKHM